MALSSRLSMILGGAGCGKGTLISAIVDCYGSTDFIICAPTGKAARNVTERTGLSAHTVHSAYGISPDEDFLTPVNWSLIDLVIVDEASMLSLELLAHLLFHAQEHCRIVLLGDLNQLQSVGAGNVIPDLLRLGFPAMELSANHRQAEDAGALYANVTGFKMLHRGEDLAMGDSFFMTQAGGAELAERIVEEVSKRYLAGESFQVLSPYNKSTALSVRAMNPLIRDRVNPMTPEKKAIICGGQTLRDGDRVMVIQNDRERDYSNGDVGILHIQSIEKETVRRWDDKTKTSRLVETDVYSFYLDLPDGRRPFWHKFQAKAAMKYLSLAYVVTVQNPRTPSTTPS